MIQADREFPHAEKKTIADHLRKFESLLTLTPQRMRMIVHAIEETLDKGLQKEGQVVPMSEFFFLFLGFRGRLAALTISPDFRVRGELAGLHPT